MKRGERGAAAVEFALVLPLLLALLFGIAEFGRAYHVQSTLSGAAREGVRVYALSNNTGDAELAVRAAASTLEPARLGVSFGPACPAAAGPSVPRTTVTATYDFNFITGWFGSGLTLNGTGTMRCNG